MGSRREEITGGLALFQSILALTLVFAAGLFLPWFVTTALAAALLFFKITSFEIILVGAFLDILLLSPNDGIRGFFFTLIFLGLSIAILIVHTLLRHNE